MRRFIANTRRAGGRTGNLATYQPFLLFSFIKLQITLMSSLNAFIFSVAMLSSMIGRAQTDSSSTGGYLISFDSTKLYYEVKGSGFPVILVHGFMNSGESWKKTAIYTSLQDAGYMVITIDMRGNGKSDKPHLAEAYANDAEAKDIINLAKKLSLSSYNLVGYSRGSIITARVLVLDNKVHKAVMGGMGTDFTNPEWPRRIMFYRALSGEPVKELEGAMNYVREAKLDQQALALMQKEQPSTSKEILATIKQPVLIVIGDADEDKEKARELANIIKGSTYSVVPGDHGTAMRTPEFASAVINFLKR
jgi:pimeloyl-ACP methyl ester carboxylesterase